MKVGFIGVGVMGNGMVKNLLKHGHQVDIYNRTRSKAHEALEAGAVWKDSVADCVREAEVVITIVGFPPDVEEVYFGAAGILENARPGTPVIDMTTTSPRLSQRIFQEAAKRGLSALDAPVSGGDAGARAGTLSIMVGGERATFEKCLPIFEAMGKSIRYMGGAGSGKTTVAVRLAKYLADKRRIDVKKRVHHKPFLAEGRIRSHGAPDIARADDDHVVRRVHAQDFPDAALEVGHIIPVSLLAEAAEAVHILPNLRGSKPHALAQRPGRQAQHALRFQLPQMAIVSRKAADYRVGYPISLMHAGSPKLALPLVYHV